MYRNWVRCAHNVFYVRLCCSSIDVEIHSNDFSSFAPNCCLLIWKTRISNTSIDVDTRELCTHSHMHTYNIRGIFNRLHAFFCSKKGTHWFLLNELIHLIKQIGFNHFGFGLRFLLFVGGCDERERSRWIFIF